jgi:excisionase family DNA binding protein
MSTGNVQVTALLEAILHGQEQLRERIDVIEDALREQRAAYLSISHAARLAELSYDHVRRAVESGELPATDKGNGQHRFWRIARDDFDRWMRKGRSGRDVLPPRSRLKEKVDRFLPGLTG